jgi:uncharacterized protein
MSGSYTIQLSGLKEGHHNIDFEIGNEFFESFNETEVKEGSLLVKVEIDKSSSLSDILITISGNVRICCDRCLEMYLQPVECEHRLLVKFGKNIEGNDPDLISLTSEDSELDLKQHFYEYIHLSLPIRRVHADDINGNSTCDPVMLNKLKAHTVTQENRIDPWWEELKKLASNN